MPTNIDRRARAIPGGAFALGLVLAAASGCGQARVSPDHRDMILRLATGTSTRDSGIIDRAAAEVDRLATTDALTEAEREAFAAIIAAARENDWDRAQRLAYTLRDGQEPTAADLERVAKRTLPGTRKPDARRTGAH